jgi:hypothetical protein
VKTHPKEIKMQIVQDRPTSEDVVLVRCTQERLQHPAGFLSLEVSMIFSHKPFLDRKFFEPALSSYRISSTTAASRFKPGPVE